MDEAKISFSDSALREHAVLSPGWRSAMRASSLRSAINIG
jgi:hypothetical protein